MMRLAPIRRKPRIRSALHTGETNVPENPLRVGLAWAGERSVALEHLDPSLAPSLAPSQTPYLAAPPARIAQWRDRIAAVGRPRIGLVWSGRPSHDNDARRSIPCATLGPLLESHNGSFVSLQPEIRDTDRDAVAKSQLIRLSHPFADFADTAAVIALLDAVVTVDTSVAHLAGALGKPVFILLPWASDFRWLLARADSPWYPTARLFRQPVPGDWASAIARVAEEIGRSP